MRAVSLLSFAVITFLCALLFTPSSAQFCTGCVNAQIGFIDGQDGVCGIIKPYCNWVATSNRCCGDCRARGPINVAGGSCDCDARTTYCSQASDYTSGLCTAYTLLNAACTSDSDCQTTTLRTESTGPGSFSGTVPNEVLFCVNNLCKPCKPSLWTTNLTCAGYDAALSSSLGRYATQSRLPPWTYNCLPNGDLEVLNTTVNYDYGYSCGSRTLWPMNCDVSSTPTGTSSPTPSRGPGSQGGAAGSVALNVVLVSGVALLLVALMLSQRD